MAAQKGTKSVLDYIRANCPKVFAACPFQTIYNLPPLQAGSGGGGGGGKKGKGKKGKGGKGRASPDPEDEEVAQVCLFMNIFRAHMMILPLQCEIGTTISQVG